MFALSLLATTCVSAHPAPFSFLDCTVGSQAWDVSLVVHVFDVAQELDVTKPDTLLTAEAVAEHAPTMIDILASRLRLSLDGAPVTLVWPPAPHILADRQSLRFDFRIPFERAPGRLGIEARLFSYDSEHKTFVNVYENGALTQAILDRRDQRFEYVSGSRQGVGAVIRRFLRAGIHHILVGPDHLLFLVGLLLPGGTMRRLLVVVTSFTLAHSVTLSLAALDLVTPPAGLVEPVIALSIVYVGLDNLLAREGRDMRAWIAFAFGLVHGFGFAGVLREMTLPARALGWSLFSFNAGVEVGQFVVVILVASVLGWARLHHFSATRQVAQVGSVLVVAAGTFWFIERVFFAAG